MVARINLMFCSVAGLLSEVFVEVKIARFREMFEAGSKFNLSKWQKISVPFVRHFLYKTSTLNGIKYYKSF